MRFVDEVTGKLLTRNHGRRQKNWQDKRIEESVIIRLALSFGAVPAANGSLQLKAIRKRKSSLFVSDGARL